MNSQENSIKLIEYIEGTLSSKDKKHIEKLLHVDFKLQEEYKILKTFFHDIDNYKNEIPSPESRNRFLEAIEDEKKKIKERKTEVVGQKILWVLGIAAGLTLIILNINFTNGVLNSFNTGKELSQIKDFKKDSLVKEMTSNPLASERLNAVYSAANLPMDQVLLDSFLEVVTEESNQNVKIAALKALENEIENSFVQEVIYKLTLDHKNPMIQIYAIDYVAELVNEKSNMILSQLLIDEATMGLVKEEAHLALFEINSKLNKSEI